MDIKNLKKRLEDEIIVPLINIRNTDEDCGFCTRQVMELRKLIIKYIKKLSKLKEPTDDVILKHMEKLIYAINKLNRKADLCLLESEIGDDVCFFIEDVAFEAGFPETDEDITYDWREEW
jgi:hypothetical protein